eukprot:EG_transcript_17961
MATRVALRSLLLHRPGASFCLWAQQGRWPGLSASQFSTCPRRASALDVDHLARLPRTGLAIRRLHRTPTPLTSTPPDSPPPPQTPVEEVILTGWQGAATYFATGFVAGAFGSAVGLGGGVLVVPLLVSMGMKQARAHGTSLVSVAATSIAGAGTYVAAGYIEPTAAGMLALTAIPMAGLGAHFASKLHGTQLKRLFGWWLVVAASLVPIKQHVPTLLDLTAAASIGTGQYCLSVGCLGAVAGFLSALLGVGGGSLLVPCLALSGFPQHVAQGTALCAMVLPTLFGSTQHHRQGNVAWRVAPFLVLGAALGGMSGGYLAVYLPERILCCIFSVGLAAIGIRYIRG